MSVSAGRPLREDGLSLTTLRIGGDLPTASIAEVVHALKRVPGVLTVDADAENAQAFVAHDPAVLVAALIAAANRPGTAAQAVIATGATVGPVALGAPQKTPHHPFVAVAGLAAMLAIVLLDFALPNSADKRWLSFMPVAMLWVLIILRAMRSRRS